VFGLHRFKLHRHLVDETVKLSGLGRFSVFSGFGLDRFHCSMILNSRQCNGVLHSNV